MKSPLFLRAMTGCLVLLALSTSAAAQDRSGLIEMEQSCYADASHPRYQSKLCQAFRYGMDFRDLQITARGFQGVLLHRSTVPDQPLPQGVAPGQLFEKTQPNSQIQQIIIPPANFNRNATGQIVR